MTRFNADVFSAAWRSWMLAWMAACAAMTEWEARRTAARK
jgi:hypothetical protein